MPRKKRYYDLRKAPAPTNPSPAARRAVAQHLAEEARRQAIPLADWLRWKGEPWVRSNWEACALVTYYAKDACAWSYLKALRSAPGRPLQPT